MFKDNQQTNVSIDNVRTTDTQTGNEGPSAADISNQDFGAIEFLLAPDNSGTVVENVAGDNTAVIPPTPSGNVEMPCRIAEPGKVLLDEDYENIWIQSRELKNLYRWKANPKEMARQLLKILVGSNNLKAMCARGHGKREAIPKDVNECVEYYVNQKCPDGLTPGKYTTAVNLMIQSLRHPKK